MQRGSGILLGILSLPGPYGIGTMGQGARDFVNRLVQSGQTYWQILPISPTGFGDSPYQSFSAFAGNPYFIDFKDLFEDNLLPAEGLDMCGALFEPDSGAVDYEAQFEHKHRILQMAFRSCGKRVWDEVRDFAQRHAGWLVDYALFMALKTAYDLKPYWEWPEALAGRDRRALDAAARQLKEQVDYHIFVQYLFFRQWEALRKYANERGIRIIGDMPIYIAADSADAWANRDMLDKRGRVAGCPPDYFSPTGQLWGNPVYDWETLKKAGYAWWVRRVAHQISLFDYLRVDHFRGFNRSMRFRKGQIRRRRGSGCAARALISFASWSGNWGRCR